MKKLTLIIAIVLSGMLIQAQINRYMIEEQPLNTYNFSKPGFANTIKSTTPSSNNVNYNQAPQQYREAAPDPENKNLLVEGTLVSYGREQKVILMVNAQKSFTGKWILNVFSISEIGNSTPVSTDIIKIHSNDGLKPKYKDFSHFINYGTARIYMDL